MVGLERSLCRRSCPLPRCLPISVFASRAFLQVGSGTSLRIFKNNLRLGEQVRTVQEEEDLVRIQTHQGPHAGRYVIDTRPMDQQNREPRIHDVHWLQHFMGWKVKTERACFQSKQVTLMDFEGRKDAAEILGVSDNETDNALPGIPFIYLLPFSPTEALVESTWFGPKVLPKSVYREQLQRYLQEKGAGNYEIIEEEYGVLPMSTLPTTTQPTRRIRHLGLAGGAARPSTGYAFLAIQRQAQRLADQLLKGDWETSQIITVPNPAYWTLLF